MASQSCEDMTTDDGAAHRAFLGRRHFPGLDGIRCISILAVIWHHSPHPHGVALFNRGFIGVDLFFILSGFLISTLLLREKARKGRVSLRNFWARRALRLMPAYYALLLSMVGAYWLFKPDSANAAEVYRTVPIAALYLSNWIQVGPNLDHSWSLSAEEQFYLTWPIIQAYCSPFVQLWSWVAALVVNQAINFAPATGQPAFVRSYRPDILQVTFTPILLGVGLAYALSERRAFVLAERLTGWRGAPLIFGAIFILILSVPVNDISGLVRLSLHVIGCLFLASILLQPDGIAAQTLEMSAIRWIGKVSYGMYLYHMLCLHVARAAAEWINLPGAAFPIAVMLTTLAATISFYAIEKPFLNLKRHFRR